MNVPDAIEPVTGYRVWTLSDGKLMPFGITGAAWVSGPNEAVCYSELDQWRKQILRNSPDGVVEESVCTHGPIPEEKCHCGIWFLNEVGEAVEKAVPRNTGPFLSYASILFGGGEITPEPKEEKKKPPLDLKTVVGEVKGWGRVIVGENGHRCEFAEIVALYQIDEAQNLSAVAEFYGVPVVARPDLLPKPEPEKKEAAAPRSKEEIYRKYEAILGAPPLKKKSFWNLLGGI